MRRSILFACSVSLCVLAAFACDDTDAPGGATLDLDAGNFDGNIPPLPLPLPTADAGDASVPQPITVTVLGSAASRADVEIVFGDQTGAVLETKRTDANGLATGPVAAKTVTALLKTEGRYSLVTWTDVASGEALAVRAVEATEPRPVVGSYNVAFTAPPLPAPVNVDVEASAYCRDSTSNIASPVPLAVEATCVFGPTSSVLAQARSFSTSNVTRYFGFKKNLALPGASTAITIDNWVAAQKATLTVTNIPSEANVAATLFELANGAPFHPQSGDLDPGLGAIDFDIAPGFADAVQAAFRVNRFDAAHAAVIVRAASAAGLGVDLGSPLPALAPTATTGDKTRPTFNWTGDTRATAGGAVQVRFPGAVDGASYAWTIFVPPGATTVTAPALPADAAAFAPDPEGTTTIPNIAFVAAQGLTPAVLRAGAFAAVDVGAAAIDLETALIATPMPGNGTYKVTSYFPFVFSSDR